MNEITQKDIDKAYERFNDFDRIEPAIIPTPTRTVEVDETVRLGGLEDLQIKEILHDGKAYRIEYTRGASRDKPATRETSIWWWFDINKLDFADRNASDMFAPHLPGQVSTSDISSLIHMMSHNGLVCDPRYQRGYVWSLADQESLIDSIFNRINIGSIIFSRHSGYLHDNSTETVKYINLDGEEVEILRSRDYTAAVIDGQQRLTTIWRFVTNQFAYKGYHWRNLSFHDQNDFTNTLLSTRTFDEDSVPYEDVLRMFIKVNKGVPQDDTHLDGVKQKLDDYIEAASNKI
jgi:hypothetical protein